MSSRRRRQGAQDSLRDAEASSLSENQSFASTARFRRSVRDYERRWPATSFLPVESRHVLGGLSTRRTKESTPLIERSPLVKTYRTAVPPVQRENSRGANALPCRSCGRVGRIPATSIGSIHFYTRGLFPRCSRSLRGRVRMRITQLPAIQHRHALSWCV